MWQKLIEDVGSDRLRVLAVALDEPEAARPWIEAAKPTYPCLIDRSHHVAELYGLVNVPEAVWIDEEGRIVRPPEPAGAYEGFRQMDRATFTMPEAVQARTRAVKQAYVEALRDWVEKGAKSVFALDEAAVRARLRTADDHEAEAHVRFRLGQALLARGREAEARTFFEEARRLHPRSWAIWRQTADKDGRGLATGPVFWARVDALGAERYYARIDMPGMP